MINVNKYRLINIVYGVDIENIIFLDGDDDNLNYNNVVICDSIDE